MDRLTRIASRCLVVAVAISGIVATLAAQQTDGASSEPQRARELTSRMFADDPGWQWVSAIDNRPGPIVKSEKRVLVGVWRRGSGDAEVLVSISPKEPRTGRSSLTRLAMERGVRNIQLVKSKSRWRVQVNPDLGLTATTRMAG